MKDLGLSAKTIRGLRAMLRQRLDQAVQERLIPYNPAAGCKLPPKEKEEISACLAAAEEHAKHLENPYMFPSPVTGKLYGPDCIGRLHKNLLISGST